VGVGSNPSAGSKWLRKLKASKLACMQNPRCLDPCPTAGKGAGNRCPQKSVKTGYFIQDPTLSCGQKIVAKQGSPKLGRPNSTRAQTIGGDQGSRFAGSACRLKRGVWGDSRLGFSESIVERSQAVCGTYASRRLDDRLSLFSAEFLSAWLKFFRFSDHRLLLSVGV
jgi:hypothetical protein